HPMPHPAARKRPPGPPVRRFGRMYAPNARNGLSATSSPSSHASGTTSPRFRRVASGSTRTAASGARMRQRAGRIGITGGSGFIGSHVADRMISEGYDVVVLDQRPPQRSDVTHRRADVLDLAAVVQATRDLDAVFHLAGMSHATDALAHPVSPFPLHAPPAP